MEFDDIILTLNDFRGNHDDSLSALNIFAQITKPLNNVLVTFSNIDIEEEIDGYSKDEMREIIDFMEHVYNRLDYTIENQSPSLFEGAIDDKEETNTTRMGS